MVHDLRVLLALNWDSSIFDNLSCLVRSYWNHNNKYEEISCDSILRNKHKDGLVFVTVWLLNKTANAFYYKSKQKLPWKISEIFNFFQYKKIWIWYITVLVLIYRMGFDFEERVNLYTVNRQLSLHNLRKGVI